MNRSINQKTRQWLWFVSLWLGGFSCLAVIAGIIKIFMNMVYS